MNFLILSIGDADYLARIFDSVAMITSAGSFTTALKISCLLGVIIVMFQAIARGGQTIAWPPVFVCMILYMGFFANTARVTIEDVYTGQVITKDNVPVGIGLAASVSSKLGIGITELFEQGYSEPYYKITKTPYIESLKLLNDIRTKGVTQSVYEKIDSTIGLGADFHTSMKNFMQECVIIQKINKKMSRERLFAQPVDTLLTTTSQIHMTELFLPNQSYDTCADASVKIKAALSNVSNDAVKLAISQAIRRDNGTNYDLFRETQNALNALQITAAGTTSAQNYIKVALIEPIYYEGAEGAYNTFMDTSSALMINQAIQQRNAQWASEHTLFLSSIRPMITFFEGFVYAVSPFMIFLLVMGAYGLAVVGRFLQTVIWIQLWLPILSITNYYISTIAGKEIKGAVGAGGDFSSMYALDSITNITQNWIGVGGMLAAATPLLALFLITGSGFAFTSLVQRLAGSDHINEKITSPDVVSPAPVMDISPQFRNIHGAGVQTVATESFNPTLDISSSAAQAQNSNWQNLQSNANTFGKTLSNTLANTTGTEASHAFSQAIGSHLMSNKTQGISQITDAATNFAKQQGFNQEQTRAFMTKVALGLGASAGMFSGGMEFQDLTTEKINQAASEFLKISSGSSLSTTEQAALMKGISQATTEASNQLSKYGVSQTDQTNLSKAATLVNQSAKSYSSSANLAQSVAGSTKYDLQQLAGNIINNSKTYAALDNEFDYVSPETKNYANHLATGYMMANRALGNSHGRAMGRIMALATSSGTATIEEQTKNLARLASVFEAGNLVQPAQVSVNKQDETIDNLNLQNMNVSGAIEGLTPNTKASATSRVATQTLPLGTDPFEYFEKNKAGIVENANATNKGIDISNQFNKFGNEVSNLPKIKDAYHIGISDLGEVANKFKNTAIKSGFSPEQAGGFANQIEIGNLEIATNSILFSGDNVTAAEFEPARKAYSLGVKTQENLIRGNKTEKQQAIETMKNIKSSSPVEQAAYNAGTQNVFRLISRGQNSTGIPYAGNDMDQIITEKIADTGATGLNAQYLQSYATHGAGHHQTKQLFSQLSQQIKENQPGIRDENITSLAQAQVLAISGWVDNDGISRQKGIAAVKAIESASTTPAKVYTDVTGKKP